MSAKKNMCLLGVFTGFVLLVFGETVDKNITKEIESLKGASKILAEQLEKWNHIFLNSLEPRMVTAATSLANIDSNVNNIQERAHVWDTFQLHVSAWNDQLATLDRKADIISKGQEKLLSVESKINSIANVEYKIDDLLNKMNNIQGTLSNLKEESKSQQNHRDSDILFGEFATRGILSTIKMVEKKLDRLLISQENLATGDKEKPRLTIKCNTPRFVEDLLKDMSSKVDIIFDKIYKKEENESDYGGEDYLDDQSDTNVNGTSGIYDKISTIEYISHKILESQQENLKYSQKIFKKCVGFDLQLYLDKAVNHHSSRSSSEKNPKPLINSEPLKNGCENLDINYSTSGVYIFGNITELNEKNRMYNKRFCRIHKDNVWTVIQKRDNYPETQNFNVSWYDYKHGFGNLEEDFWFGNDFIAKLSKENNLVLRIELEDFEGHQVWAEYSHFSVLPESNNYQILISGYQGNATDSFSSHNGSFFSTFDRKNDQAPECCPCAVSYGGGWWFNSCFESNLNGIYFQNGHDNGHFGGIIWENWLGDYSLKKSLLMVKFDSEEFPEEEKDITTLWPFYEDP